MEDDRHAATVTGSRTPPSTSGGSRPTADWPGAVRDADHPRRLGARRRRCTSAARAARAGDLATLIYTSGTTGRPKGCELTHANLVAEVRTVITVLPELLDGRGSLLLFLPLAHVFGKVVQCAVLDSRTVLGHSPDAKHLLDDLAAFRPTVLLAVPRVFEKVFHGARRKAVDGGKGKIFDAATATAVAWSEACDAGGPGVGLKLRRALFDVLVYRRLRAALGGQVRAAVSGSAPLTAFLGHFFRGIGLPVLEGYGLTETTAAISVNTLTAQRIGTVGRPIPGQTVRIADDGEILVRGPVVFRGYHEQPGRHRRGADRRLVPHRRRRRARRRRVPADHRPQEGDPRHRRRQERRSCGARRPAAGAPAHRAGPRRR